MTGAKYAERVSVGGAQRLTGAVGAPASAAVRKWLATTPPPPRKIGRAHV